MSRMEVTPEEDARMKESRLLLREAWNVAFGSYIEQEAKKKDQWRDQTWGELYGHMKHEFGEMSKSKSLVSQLHNAIDLVMLGNILLAKILERERNE